MGLKICVEKNYADHIGIKDEEFKKAGVEIKNSPNEVLNSCNLLIKVNCPSENEINNIKENTILIGMLNPSQNKNRINDILKKNKYFFFWNFYHVSQEPNQWMYCHHNQI